MDEKEQELKAKAAELADEALVFHWQWRVKAEKENRAPFGQITTVKDCYAHGFLAGVKYARERAEQGGKGGKQDT